jgi:hypothetical protein
MSSRGCSVEQMHVLPRLQRWPPTGAYLGLEDSAQAKSFQRFAPQERVPTAIAEGASRRRFAMARPCCNVVSSGRAWPRRRTFGELSRVAWRSRELIPIDPALLSSMRELMALTFAKASAPRLDP